jgi:hypothetical protein
MNGEGSRSDRDGTVEVDDNVIRLTDWLGPREELVPFGPAADAAEAARSQVATEPSAADFWSESSAAVQDALADPHFGHRPRSAEERHRGRASAAAVWSRRRAALHTHEIPWPASLAPAQARRVAATAIALTAVVVIGALFTVIGGPAPRTTRPRSVAAVIDPGAASRHASEIASAARGLDRRTVRASHRATEHHGALTVRRRRVSHHHAAAASPTAGAQPVGYTTPAPPSPTDPTQTETAAQSSPATSSSPATTGAGTGSSSASQQALGANGALAPGSSPDG